jgi:hypothetical protein
MPHETNISLEVHKILLLLHKNAYVSRTPRHLWQIAQQVAPM